jgi:hypothetical protein
MQAYKLVEQLLGCSLGTGGNLLQANAELVDAGMLGVMEQWQTLEGQGRITIQHAVVKEFAGQLRGRH